MQINIGIIRRCEQSFLRERLSAYHLKPIEGIVLASLRKKNRCNQESLCCCIDIDKGRMARIMERLELRKLIHRVINPSNKREKLIELTKEGEEMLVLIDSFFLEWSERCFIGFTDEEKKQYQNYLKRITENALKGKEAYSHD